MSRDELESSMAELVHGTDLAPFREGRFGDYIHEPIRESNGAKAARQAAEHVTELEQELEKARYAHELCEKYRQETQAKLDQLEQAYQTMLGQRDHYMLQCTAFKQSLSSAASVLINAIRQDDQASFKPEEH